MALIGALGWELNTMTAGLEMPAIAFPNGTTGQSVQGVTVQNGSVALKALAADPGMTTSIESLSTNHKQTGKIGFLVKTLPTVESTIFDNVTNNGVLNALLTIGTDAKLRLYYSLPTTGFGQIGSASAALSLNTWYFIEIKVDDTGGLSSFVIEARLNGSVIASGTENTFASGNGVPSSWWEVASFAYNGGSFSGNSGGEWYFDNVVFTDGSGANMTGYVGDMRLARLTPNAAGDANTFATQTGGTAGGSNNFTRVDETTPDGATTFNGSSTLNQVDMFNVSDPSLASNVTVAFVQVMAQFRNSTADATATAKLQIEKAASGTIAQGGSITPNSTTFKTTTPAQSLITYTDPDGAAWTETTLATAQIGYKLTTAPGTAGRRIDFSNVWAYVGYNIATTNSITQSLKYTVKVTPSAITKSLKYAVKVTPSAITKSLKYTIKITQSAITKALKYTVKTTPSAITKGLVYDVAGTVTTNSLTKSLKYTIKRTPSAITQSLQYTIKKAVSLTKSLKYTVPTTPSAITKSLQYAVKRTPSAITKSLAYYIRRSPSLTKSLQYTVKAPTALTKSLKYTVPSTKSLTKSLQYTIRVTPSAITKSLAYSVRKAISLTKSLQYAVRSEPVITKSLKYTLITTPAAITKSLHYAIKITPSAVTKSLEYAIKLPVSLTKSLQYTIKQTPVAISKGLTYSLKRQVAITKSLEYLITKQISLTKSLQYTIKRNVSLTKSLEYTVRKANALTKNLQYAVRVNFALTKSLAYYVRNQLSLTKSLQYAINRAVNIQLGLKYTVPGIVHTITKGLTYHIHIRGVHVTIASLHPIITVAKLSGNITIMALKKMITITKR